jgi:hypothetical protein
MKPAVLMMFRDEADILGKCLEHWYGLGVRDFYLIDNRSGDTSSVIAQCFADEHRDDTRVYLDLECATDWPGRRVINNLKNRALDDGCDWLFPADADEFLVLPSGESLKKWLEGFNSPHVDLFPGWLEMPYLNVLPDGREYWQEPQRKAFGVLTEKMTISMGNHLIEEVGPIGSFGKPDKARAHYRHYSLRSYPQFRRKMENYMTAFHQTQFQDHHHAVDFHHWQAEGEAFIQHRWTELTGLEP